jgi:small-conductance mechanosensitive channel
VVQVLNLFEQGAAKNIQTYIPYLAILLGALVVFGLLKITNRILR